ncbi:MAG: hypothetical protein A6F72_06990 [Cycloclasticus sp. symbiont of Poecilosclerida sp. N]|nr:MAG: hypothetical protein A6F72_06990 [Cycloclasticus sp. symbiont of Poecilosclerida sp. N]
MGERAISLVEKKSIITDFLQQCNAYSDGMLEKYQAQLEYESTKQSALQKIHDWTVYRKFNEHAIKELESAELDGWFK